MFLTDRAPAKELNPMTAGQVAYLIRYCLPQCMASGDHYGVAVMVRNPTVSIAVSDD